MIKLTLTEKGGEPRLLTFDKDEITIGRVSGNDIVLAKGNVSKRHSRFTSKPGGQFEVADLKSTNGTYVNGRKIAGPTILAANDRVYVGDFLITIDTGEAAAQDDLGGEEAGAGSASHRLPVPPPPPPPRGGSRASALPAVDEETGGYGDEEDDDLGLAARPPRSGRMPIPPPPPPPPPRRPPTPLASRAVDRLDDDLDLPPAPVAEEDTGSVGLFANTRPADEEVSRRVSLSARPGPAAAPTFAPPPPASPAAPVGGVTDVGNALGLEALLADASVRQILITASDAVMVDRGGGLTLHEGSLGDPNAVADALWRLANTAFPPPAPDNPVVDVRLHDGTRMSAAFPPASPGGVVVAIRRPTVVDRELRDLLPGADGDAEALLAGAIQARRNLLVTGDVGAVAQALGAIGTAIPADRRVVAIGAAQSRPHGGWMDLAPSADAAGLLRVAAGFRAEHLVVGDLVGPEASELALLAARGQDGLIVALPGRSPAEALSRLTALVAVGLQATAAAAPLTAATFDLAIQVVSATDGSARIVEISEPRLLDGTVTAEPVLSYAGNGAHREPGGGRLEGRGVSARLADALAAVGRPVPPALRAQ